jgi:hypothetical protein
LPSGDTAPIPVITTRLRPFMDIYLHPQSAVDQ